jgi:5-oxoprolinase (ATP-hydrolysing)
MTNTRITDVEIMERRLDEKSFIVNKYYSYPIIIRRFCLRKGSGGGGRFRGGDGLHREYVFRTPLTLSILTERRVFAPYGLEGGHNGQRGDNVLLLADGAWTGVEEETDEECVRLVQLPSKASVDVVAGVSSRQ